jgi:hypothetical protein
MMDIMQRQTDRIPYVTYLSHAHHSRVKLPAMSSPPSLPYSSDPAIFGKIHNQFDLLRCIRIYPVG